MLWDKYPLLLKINKCLIRKLGGVIISGNSHIEVFGDFVHHGKIHIVPNFALDYLFVNEELIQKKYNQIEKIKILYISNMIEKKGYFELAKAYTTLSFEHQTQIEIDFAGRFELETQKKSFLEYIENHPNMRYHGVVENEKKKDLYQRAHVFALPTGFFEGQPVSILEAYASGCFVITTGQSGILDIFKDKINGFQFANPKAYSIKLVLEELLKSKSKLESITIQNLHIANQKYRKQIYNNSLAAILEDKVLNNQKLSND
jgi:glycosyltransferase involved in cell wall biosynthesis